MAEGYTKRFEGPDGQYVVLLTRLPYDRALQVEEAFATEPTAGKRADAVLRALLWDASVKDYLTDEVTADINAANPALIADWRDEATVLYLAWRKEAFPGPKGSSKTGRSTPPSSKE